MELHNRNYCLITENEDLELLHKFDSFPVFMGCVDNEDLSNDIVSEMSWWISKSSGSIQLNPVPDLNLIYAASHGSGTIGKTWENHHTELAKFILNYAGENVLEIGGGHGFLANHYLNRKPKGNWTLVDPNPTVAIRENLKIIKGFFPVDSDQKYDTIVHSHLFEHMLDPKSFCKELSNALKDRGYLIFSIPNLGEILKRKYTNVLNFEHTFFLSEYFAEYFIKTAGFEVLEKQVFLKDHSIFYAARKSKGQQGVPLVNQYSENLKLYRGYIDHHIKLINDLNKIINATEKKVFLFGGHAMSQFLIAFGLNTEKVHCIIDNDPNKQGRRLNGTNMKVWSPGVLKTENAPVVILRAGAFQSEISEQLRLINPEVKIIPSGS